ncbi:MAG: cation diffusion facilitator family transporter [Eubacterium sp.]|nr:cation diffusion facilitator family transporter [Eubacterium sp.]
MEMKPADNRISDSQTEEFSRIATRVSIVSILGNLGLSIFKLLAGILAHSGAMISDAVHSASDVVSSFIVIIGVRMSGKAPDKDHPYGHERFECVAAIILAMLLAIVGAEIGLTAIKSIREGSDSLTVPGTLALIAAVVSIIVKEAMFWYTRAAAIRIRSTALKADAWHHRSDALSSVGALIGIGGAMLGYPILEPIASIVICLFIFKVAVDVFKGAIDQMVDHRCDDETEEQLRSCIQRQEGVQGVDLLQTRMFGSRIYVDIEIRVDGSLRLIEAHEIAEQVHDAIEEAFPSVKHVMVHVNPA